MYGAAVRLCALALLLQARQAKLNQTRFLTPFLPPSIAPISSAPQLGVDYAITMFSHSFQPHLAAQLLAGFSAFFFYGFLSSVALTPYNFVSVSFVALSCSALPIL